MSDFDRVDLQRDDVRGTVRFIVMKMCTFCGFDVRVRPEGRPHRFAAPLP